MPKKRFFTTAIRQKLRQQSIRQAFNVHQQNLQIANKRWLKGNPPSDYNQSIGNALQLFFGHKTPLTLENVAKALAPKTRPLRVLDDGAGFGLALARLKEKLQKQGIQTHTTAVVLRPHKKLSELHAKRRIDHVHAGLSEFFDPKKPQDLILSIRGSMLTTLPEFRKDLLLKYCHSLAKGGVLVMEFPVQQKPEEFDVLETEQDPSRELETISTRLSARSNAASLKPMKEEMHAIEKSFSKRGFNARFIEVPPFGATKQTFVLIVQRQR